MARAPLRVRVEARRRALGLGRAELARAAGISRQALAAIADGRSVPSTAVALRLSRVLGCRVEDLFALEEELPGLDLPSRAAPGTRLAIGQVGGRWVGLPLDPRVPAPADATVGPEGRVEPLLPPERLARHALVAGCAPVLRLAAAMAGGGRRGRVAWVHASSGTALAWLRAGLAHVAGLHLAPWDAPQAHDRLLADLAARVPLLVVTMVGWREGLAVRAGDPRAPRRVEDLAAPGLRLARREPGSGAARALAAALAGVGLEELARPGPAVGSHEEGALAVALGAADAAPCIEPVARAHGLAFVPLSEERFELVLPLSEREHPGVARLLDALADRRFRTQVRALGPYVLDRTGERRVLGAA